MYILYLQTFQVIKESLQFYETVKIDTNIRIVH